MVKAEVANKNIGDEVQTRKQEIITQNVKDKNKYLFETAKLARVKNYGKFNNYRYGGLHDGETAIAENLFRITQTDEVLKNKNINNEDDACITHHKVGQAVRQTIKKIGGRMPEDLPTPSKSAKQIEKEKNEKLEFINRKKIKKGIIAIDYTDYSKVTLNILI